MRAAREEMSHWREFDHVVVNAELAPATSAVRSVLHAARSATSRQVWLRSFAM
jgi:guanylate kinase